jgi:phage shock protein PspC (stress-responsive transcriptional regulator)
MARPGHRQHAGTMNTTAADPEADHHAQSHPEAQAEPEAQPPSPARPDRLSRPVHDRMVAGVAAGLGRYIGVDVTVVRIVIAVLAIAGGIGLPIYLAGWLLIPEEGCEQSIAGEFLGLDKPARIG